MTELDPAQPPQPKKKMSGCLIAVIALGAVVALVGVVIAVAVWKLSQDPEVRQIFNAGTAMVKMMQESQTAPGAAEVRGLGCAEAGVVDLRAFLALTPEHGDAGPEASAGKPTIVVFCQVTEGSGPACDAVAKAYFGAVPHAPGDVEVYVARVGEKEAKCQRHYAETGESIGDATGQMPSFSIHK